MSHDQPTYASVPGIRVYGMMCVTKNGGQQLASPSPLHSSPAPITKRRARPLRTPRSLNARYSSSSSTGEFDPLPFLRCSNFNPPPTRTYKSYGGVLKGHVACGAQTVYNIIVLYFVLLEIKFFKWNIFTDFTLYALNNTQYSYIQFYSVLM